MKKILCLIFILILCDHVLAATLTCTGMDTIGTTIHLLMDPITGTVNINGSIYSMKPTNNKKVLTTENFIDTSGVFVYDAFYFSPPRVINIYQYNAVTKQLVAFAGLSCYKSS